MRNKKTPNTDYYPLADDNHALQIANMYFDEWRYRHENYWKRLIQLSIITFFATSLPVSFQVFGNLKLPEISLLLFPVCGVVLALLCLVLCLSESSHLSAIAKVRKRIIQVQFGNDFFPDFISLHISVWFPIVLTILQIALAVLMVWTILQGKI